MRAILLASMLSTVLPAYSADGGPNPKTPAAPDVVAIVMPSLPLSMSVPVVKVNYCTDQCGIVYRHCESLGLDDCYEQFKVCKSDC